MNSIVEDAQMTVTDSAMHQLQELGVDEDVFLRLSVKRGGCAGMLYEAALDDQVSDEDELLYENAALRIIANWKFGPHLEGLVIDFSSDLIRPGFTLTNPNAQTACGCGASFAAEGGAPSEGCCG